MPQDSLFYHTHTRTHTNSIISLGLLGISIDMHSRGYVLYSK